MKARGGDFQIFLAHANEDKVRVRELYGKLKEAGYKPWLDKIDLIPGQRWREEIPKAIARSDLFIACLSENSIKKQGYIQQEFRLALNQYAERPPGEIYFIPLKLDDCEIPDLRQEEYGVALRDFQWLDYWEEDGFEQLQRAIAYRLAQVTARSAVPEPDPIPAPPGEEDRTEPLSEERAYRRGEADNQATPNPPAPMQEGRASAKAAEIADGEWRSSKFQFEVVRVSDRGEEISREPGIAQGFWEELGNGVRLPMLWIPGGSFMMGSPETERYRNFGEGPQHEVTVPSFYMGKYPITQEQWREIVTNLPQVERELNPNPSRFKGSDRPVEKVSWEEAVEFCARLTKQTGRTYRLPTEAEWEYACRAGTTTPFHFGETITTDLANYNDGPRGEYRKETTSVGQFPVNAYGLHDMHGNVYEWCADHPHNSYKGAPTDGSAWLRDKEDDYHVIRGGSWHVQMSYCRSASRYDYNFKPSNQDYNYGIGFRVVCSTLRT